jgi:hypothetical protein
MASAYIGGGIISESTAAWRQWLAARRIESVERKLAKISVAQYSWRWRNALYRKYHQWRKRNISLAGEISSA